MTNKIGCREAPLSYEVALEPPQVISKEESVSTKVPNHVVFIPDGNRRFAKKHRLSLQRAYRLGAEKLLQATEWCWAAGINHLTSFCGTQENIQARPREEIKWMYDAALVFLRRVVRDPRINLHVFGDVSALSTVYKNTGDLLDFQSRPLSQTAELMVHIGLNYSGQHEVETLLDEIEKHGLAKVQASPSSYLLSSNVPEADLVVRTGGYQRLSALLPMQTTYAELWFTPVLWPEFERDQFDKILAWFVGQERHFGE